MNKPYFRYIAVIAAIALFATLPVSAQETTGSITGVVKDPGGAVLPGAVVTATGSIGSLQSVTDGKGEYRFPRLPSGVYTLKATMSGFSPKTSKVDLTVGASTRADFSLTLSAMTETVVVEGSATPVDITTSATTTSISRERIDLIPRGRDFTDVVTQAAGAANESQAGGISIDGASGSENRFIIDGIDTTSPQIGTSSVPLRADFLEEVQVKSAGYAAEFGGSLGGVINAITKSGANAFHGGVLAQYEDRSWGGDVRSLLRDSLTSNTFTYINPPKDKETRIDPGLFLSGPILKDRLWFFGSYQPGIRKTDRTVTFQNGVTNTFSQDFMVNYGTANITGNLSSKLLFRLGANFSPYSTERTLPGQDGRTTLTQVSQYERGTDGKRNTFSGSIDYTPSSKFVVSARAGRYRTDAESTGVNFVPLIHNFSTASTPAGIAALPEAVRQPAGFTSDVLVTDAQAKDEYKRDYTGIDATGYFSGLGEHQLKIGYQTEKIFNDVQRGYNADRILYYAGRTYQDTTGVVRSGQYGYFRLLNISTLGDVTSRNEAIFLQDTWNPTPRLTLNLGVRAEHERIPNFGERGLKTPIEFKWSDKLAPRIGFAWDATGDAKWKIYGSYGQYYDVMKYEMPRGSFGGDKWVDYFYTWDNPDYRLNGAGCATGSNTVSERPTCGAGRLIEPVDRRFNSAEDIDSAVDPDLKPMQDREYQLGVKHELGSSHVVGARFVVKNLVRTIEDVGIVVPGIGEVYYIANPGEGISLSLNDPSLPKFPKAQRDYRAMELTYEKRFSNNWGLFGSYTLSRLFGNYSGLASSDENGRTSPNVNRYFDHIEDTFDRNGQRVTGRLGTDRPHQFKAQFIYRFGFDMNVSVNQYVASGIPVTEQAFVGTNIPFFPYGRGNLGRTPVLKQTDVAVYQNFKMNKLDIQVGVTVLNLLDSSTVTRLYNSRTTGSVPVTTAQFFRGFNYEALLAATPAIGDVKFNQPDQYQAPREVRLSAKISF
jgi:hypothetical protein